MYDSVLFTFFLWIRDERPCASYCFFSSDLDTFYFKCNFPEQFLCLARPVSTVACVLLFRLPCMQTVFDEIFFPIATFLIYLSTSFCSVFRKKGVRLIGLKVLVICSLPDLGMKTTLPSLQFVGPEQLAHWSPDYLSTLL